MRSNEQTNTKSPGDKSGAPPPNLPDVGEEAINFQVLQRLARIENTLNAMNGRLDEFVERLSSIDARLAEGRRGSGVGRVVVEKPNVRNTLTAMLFKGWVSETEAMEKTGWQTIGVRSLITKLRTQGFAVETEERDGVPYYRMAK